MFRWFEARRTARALRRHAIPDSLWLETVQAHPFLQRPAQELAELRRLSSLFLASKEFHATGGLELTDRMAVAVAAQACLPVLKLSLDLYDGFVGIVLQPDEVVARREDEDDIGVVHVYDEALVGEAVEGGPLMLSWAHVDGQHLASPDGFNVVIHEFVHVIDLADGYCDGVPPMANAAARHHWLQTLASEFERFNVALDDVEAGRAPQTLLDPYGTEGLDEFFPVACEAFFTVPRDFEREHPSLYKLFASYFQQRP